MADNRRQGNFYSVQAQMERFRESLMELVNDPKERRKIYLSLMRKQARPVVQLMRSKIKGPKQTRLRNGIAARAVTISHLRSRGARGQEALQPVIHVGPLRGKGVYTKDGEKVTKKAFAPYWAWVAYGTRERNIKSNKTVHFKTESGEWRTVRKSSRGSMAANPYADKTASTMQPILDSMSSKVLQQMERQYDKILTKKGLNRKR